jgi:hypothetical protein
MSPLFFLISYFCPFFFVVVLIGLSSLFFFYPRNYILDALSSFTVASAASISTPSRRPRRARARYYLVARPPLPAMTLLDAATQ